MGFDWNPLDWANSLLGDVGSIGSDVYNFITQAVSSAVNLVENDVATVWNQASQWVDDLANQAWGWFETAEQDAAGLADQALNDAEGLVNQGLATANSWVNSAIHYGEQLFNQAVNDAESLVGEAESVVRGWVDDAINDAEGLVNDLEGAVNAGLNSVLSWVENDVLAPLTAALDFVIREWSGPIHFVENELTEAYKLVMGAEGWLVWLAKLPFEGIHDFEEALSGRVTLSSVMHAGPNISDAFSDIEKALVHVIG